MRWAETLKFGFCPQWEMKLPLAIFLFLFLVRALDALAHIAWCYLGVSLTSIHPFHPLRALDAHLVGASEADYGAVFFNEPIGVWIRIVLLTLEYPQPATYFLRDNECAVGHRQQHS